MKWGIIGLGSIAHKFASELLLEKEEVYAVASRSLDKAKEFASQYQCSHYYGSYDEILEDENIDIIYVATPHNLHVEITLKALEKNKKVLAVEVPFLFFLNQFFRILFSESFRNLMTKRTAEIVNPKPSAIHIPKAPIFKVTQRKYPKGIVMIQ